MLTTGVDSLNGTNAAETFTARVAQNVNGEQTNQLATGDQIDGKGGIDTLSAKVIAASALNGQPGMAITPETVSVEKVAFTALTTKASVGYEETAEINAKFMNGLTTISSVHSDASLLVTNVNTLRDDGVYANKRNTDALTVRMDHSGNDAVIAESDMTVLLDNDYLLSGATTLSEALYHLLDEKAELALINGTAATGTGRLQNIDTNGLMFTIDGKAYTLQSEAARKAGTHEGFVAELNKQLALDIAAGKIPAGVTLTLDATRTDKTGLDNGDISRDIPAIVLSVTTGSIVATGFAKPSNLTGAYDVYGVFDNANDRSNLPITINVELEKVGRGSDGGDLTIGGMATDLKNEWDFSSSDTLEEGIEKFIVTVSGDASQFSSLASLQSTNNTLQTVVVKSATGSEADLIIGNHNTEGAITNALKDVRDFDSKAFANDVTLHASITDESVAKYMSLTDTGAPAADNAVFNYDFGKGDDTLNLNISKANLAAAGSTTREDFELSIDTADGDDMVTVQIGDGKGAVTDVDEVVRGDNWLINSGINNNLDISTGNGADTVKLNGAGVWDVITGAGDDTVYSDNSGDKAVWVFNTANQGDSGFVPVLVEAVEDAKSAYDDQLEAFLEDDPENTKALFDASDDGVDALDAIAEAEAALALAWETAATDINDLESADNDSYALYKATVEVNFKGLLSKKIEIASDNYQSTDLQINQAIKKAINEDDVLKKLLVAVDGPANTLIVKSLIDGEQVDGDLELTFEEPATLTAAEETAVADAEANVADLFTSLNGTDSFYATAFAVDSKTEEVLSGSFSEQSTSNKIEGGADNDVIVLSTGNDGELQDIDLFASDVVVFQGKFGDDTVVNFTAAVTGLSGDVLDFTALGGKGSAFASSTLTTDGLIMVVDTTTANNTEAAVKTALSAADNTVASKGVYVAVDEATNVGTVYQIVDGAAASDLTVTEVGTIHLADTLWSTLGAANFA